MVGERSEDNKCDSLSLDLAIKQNAMRMLREN